ncbi:uncharacterized protein LOC117641470 isoform X2 [Thrips palmi]|uniref:Uncharacterized protein LOC117641470 isoform X2 n=1 Tax=Thrips palmi TaxID=161013 RepID=A0A6P8Y569_THRPL|nr:uncharacterized protein LOC117641470 isoform X2 [Thrips palmi]
MMASSPFQPPAVAWPSAAPAPAAAPRPRRSIIDLTLPTVEGDFSPPPPPSKGAYLALLVSLVFEATVPSLQCYWGLLLVFWASDAGFVHQLPPVLSNSTFPVALPNSTLPSALANATLSGALSNTTLSSTLSNTTLSSALSNTTLSSTLSNTTSALSNTTLSSTLFNTALSIVFSNATPSSTTSNELPSTTLPTSSFTLLDLGGNGLLWTPVLFSASWSVADPWSETLGAVHGHPRLCSLVGSVLLAGGLLLTAVGGLLAPRSALLPILAGISAGMTSGVGASLLSRSARLVLGQLWGERAALTLGARRLVRALGLTMVPLVALPLCQHFGASVALLVAAVASTAALLAPFVLGMSSAPPPAPSRPSHEQEPDKYERLKEWRLAPARQDSEGDGDARTEMSDDGGSEHAEADGAPRSAPPSNPGPHAVAEVPPGTTTVVAEVHCDGAGERQHPDRGPNGVPNGLALKSEATARLGKATNGTTSNGTASNGTASDAARAGSVPRPIYGEDGQAWNIAYSFDCDGDDDIELFVRRQSPRKGSVARLCSMLRPHSRGCRADLRPVLKPSFHLSLVTLACCRLAGIALPVLLPSLAIAQLGARAKTHVVAALPAVAGVGHMLFGLAVLWEWQWDSGAAASADGPSRRRLLGVVSAVAAAGFMLLSWGRSQWWLMLGCLAAGYGSAGATWAQRYATRAAMGGATCYRAQPLLCVLAGLVTAIAPALVNVDIRSCMAILAGMYTALSAAWLLQPFVARFC